MSIAPISSPSIWSTPATTSVPASSGLSAPSSSDGASAAKWFTDYMSETPAQHMRDAILKTLGLSEDDLKKMDPKQRQAVEDEIAKRLKDQILHQTQDKKKAGVLVDVTA